jgi:excisionase family DNA binding protein
MHNNTAPISVTVPEAVKLTGIGRTSLYYLMRDGKLPRRKCGAKTLILVSDLQRFVESLSEAA